MNKVSIQPSGSAQQNSAPKSVIWQTTSSLLILTGLFLMGWGGWLFYQQQAEASKPPPAPIVDSAAVFAATYTPTETPLPTATLQPSPSSISSEPAATLLANSAPTVTPARTNSPTPASRLTVTSKVKPSPTPAASQPAAADPNSLVEDPLLFREMALAALSNEVDAATTNLSNLPIKTVTSPLTRLVAESIELDTPVIGVGWTEIIQNGQPLRVWTVAEDAAGWHKNSMLPGQGGNIVLSGHHNIKGEVFRYIVELEIGDTITLYMGDQPYTYTVNDKFIVKDKGEPEEVRLANARWIGPFGDERVTLVTCWPYNSNTHRVVVIAKPGTKLPVNGQFPVGITVNEDTTLRTQ